MSTRKDSIGSDVVSFGIGSEGSLVLVQSSGVPKAIESFFDRPAHVPPALSKLIETPEVDHTLGRS